MTLGIFFNFTPPLPKIGSIANNNTLWTESEFVNIMKSGVKYRRELYSEDHITTMELYPTLIQNLKNKVSFLSKIKTVLKIKTS
jgi:hypothetical protein